MVDNDGAHMVAFHCPHRSGSLFFTRQYGQEISRVVSHHSLGEFFPFLVLRGVKAGVFFRLL